jgi:alpha-galactosidase
MEGRMMDKRFIRAGQCGDELNAYRFQSGRQVLDEALIEGHYLTRYRNAFGQIVPEMHLNSARVLGNATSADAASCFRLQINGRYVDGNWKVEAFGEIEDWTDLSGEAKAYGVTLVDDKVNVAVTVLTRLNGGDFIVRALRIENRSGAPIALTRVSPLYGLIWSHSHRSEAAPPDAEFSMAYNHLKPQLTESDFYFDTVPRSRPDIMDSCLTDGITLSGDTGKSGWQRPGVWLRNNMNGETLVCEFAWSGNWQIHAHTVPYNRNAMLVAEVGLLPLECEALRVLMPGEAATSPQVHFALLRESVDKIVQLTHDHVRGVVLPPLPEGVPPCEIEANHRGYLCDRETEEGIKADEEVAKAVGAEMYVVDAGWYGRKFPNEWWNNVGDWVAGPWLKNGFEPIPDHAHALGMRFGLWIEIEALGEKCETRDEHPEWLMKRHGVPCAIGRFGSTRTPGRALNLADPEVEEYAYQTIAGAVERYHLDMYRIDHNHDIGIGGTREKGGFTENTLWRYYEAFERIFRRLRQNYPALVLQNCASGGGRMDWGTMHLFHNTELSDWMRRPRDVRIFGGMTMSLPPEVLLRSIGTEVGDHAMESDLDTQIRVGIICRPIYRGIAPSLAELTPFLGGKISAYNKLYKDFMRPLMVDCNVYHHTPFQPIMEPAAHTIFEYAKKDCSAGMMILFAQTNEGAGAARLFPRGLSREKTYRVTFLNSGEKVRMSGLTLRSDGVAAEVGQNMGSEMLLFEEVQ